MTADQGDQITIADGKGRYMKIAAFWGLALMTLAACGQTEGAPKEQPVADKAKPVKSTAAVAVSAPAGARTAGRGTVDLTPYIGKYPFDIVGGHRFLDNPAVKAAIAAAVPDAKQRATINFEDGDLGLPIVRVKGGRILVWGGSRRAEDRYNWAVIVAPDGSKPEVCIYDGLGYDGDFQSSQWFEPGSPSIMKQGKCPSESADYPAAAIAAG